MNCSQTLFPPIAMEDRVTSAANNLILNYLWSWLLHDRETIRATFGIWSIHIGIWIQRIPKVTQTILRAYIKFDTSWANRKEDHLAHKLVRIWVHFPCLFFVTFVGESNCTSRRTGLSCSFLSRPFWMGPYLVLRYLASQRVDAWAFLPTRVILVGLCRQTNYFDWTVVLYFNGEACKQHSYVDLTNELWYHTMHSQHELFRCVNVSQLPY